MLVMDDATEDLLSHLFLLETDSTSISPSPRDLAVYPCLLYELTRRGGDSIPNDAAFPTCCGVKGEDDVPGIMSELSEMVP